MFPTAHIREDASLDTLLNRGRVPLAGPHRSEGMPALHEHQENQHCQPKIIVVRSANNLAEIGSLKFGRGIFRFAYLASEIVNLSIAVLKTYLDRITVHQRDERLRGDENITFVQIANDIPFAMQ